MILKVKGCFEVKARHGEYVEACDLRLGALDPALIDAPDALILNRPKAWSATAIVGNKLPLALECSRAIRAIRTSEKNHPPEPLRAVGSMGASSHSPYRA